MRHSTAAIVFSCIIVFLGLIIMPIYYLGIIQWRDDMNDAMVASRNFVDSIIDTGSISEDMENDFALTLASCDMGFTYKIERETKYASPNEPLIGNTSAYKYANATVSYVYTDDLTHFTKGDIVSITVTPTKFSAWQRIAMLMLNGTFSKKEIHYSAMVRTTN